jgi:hypothetical protein
MPVSLILPLTTCEITIESKEVALRETLLKRSLLKKSLAPTEISAMG